MTHDVETNTVLYRWLFLYLVNQRHTALLETKRLVCTWTSYYSNTDGIWETIGSLRQLEHLDITNILLMTPHPQHLPAPLFNLRNLKSLYCSQNQISDLPPEIANLSQLERLHAFKNRLTSLPEELGDLKNLKELVLNENELSKLPNSLLISNQLSMLNIRHNRFTALPNSLLRLPKLNALFVSNQFESTFGKGRFKSLHFDTWEHSFNLASIIDSIQNELKQGDIHSISFAFGSERDFDLYEQIRHQFPDLAISFEWRREAYY